MQKTILTAALCVFTIQTVWGEQPQTTPTPQKLNTTKTPDFFPIAVQFSPVPSGRGWDGKEGPLSEQTIRDTIDNLIAHGFTAIYLPTRRPKAEEDQILSYAQSRGMVITWETGGLEGFGREQPPKPSVYSPEYAQTVRSNVERVLATAQNIPRLHSVFAFQDEPFHWGPKSFATDPEVKAEFKKRYGYDLPTDINAVRNDPKKWLDVINFQSDGFPDGWRQVYKAVKQVNPNFKVIMTHDSHNTFGAGYSSHSELFIDDVFHWGGDFADLFVFDIYPYMMFDFRFGEPAKLPKPRISQMHYSIAQMRNLTRAYGKELGFWVGTYSPAWFKPYMSPEREASYWSEREMSTTAVAAGANYLLTGFNVPSDTRHWDSFGDGLRLIQKAGKAILESPKKKARAAMLFPRTQLIQVQEEYFNVGLSFELFLRAFGELDILHEEQIKDDQLDGYQALVLFDVSLLPTDVATRIASFVEKGGVVIADCVPSMDANKQPNNTMEQLFGVNQAKTGRIRRSGHWVPVNSKEGNWANRPESAPDESKFTSDALRGTALGQTLDLTLISPRSANVTTGEVLLKTAAGQPAVVHRKVGKGHVYLLGFCLQDTYFKTWQDGKPAAREQLAGLLRGMTDAAGVRAHVRSSNADIEASIRSNATEGFLFVINHEATVPETVIQLSDLGFDIGQITDVTDGQAIPVTRKDGFVELTLSVPVGQTRLLHVTAK